MPKKKKTQHKYAQRGTHKTSNTIMELRFFSFSFFKSIIFCQKKNLPFIYNKKKSPLIQIELTIKIKKKESSSQEKEFSINTKDIFSSIQLSLKNFCQPQIQLTNRAVIVVVERCVGVGVVADGVYKSRRKKNKVFCIISCNLHFNTSLLCINLPLLLMDKFIIKTRQANYLFVESDQLAH